MRYLFVLFVNCILVACSSTTPGGVSEFKSDYDDTLQVKATPGWSGETGGNQIKLGLLKNSKMPREDAFLIVRNDEIKNFQLTGDSFFLKVDGKEYAFSTSDPMDCKIQSQTDGSHCEREYDIKLNQVEEILAAKEVKFRLLMQDGSVIDGGVNLSANFTSAYSGLKSFIESIKKNGMY